MINFLKKADGADSDDETSPVQKYFGLSDRPLRNGSNLSSNRPKTRTDTERIKTKVSVLTPLSPRNTNDANTQKESYNHLNPIHVNDKGDNSD